MPRSASDELRDAIRAGDGALRFDEFVRIALYGESGFYTSGGSAGRRGDFITSPEVGPLFGAVLARWIDATWHDLGRPTEFTVVEAGAGPGTLARSIRAASPAALERGRYIAVEISVGQRGRHPDGIVSQATMPTEPFVGVVIANELLDNLPFRLLVMDGGWREAHVVESGDGFAEVLTPFDDIDPATLPVGAPHGARIPVQEHAGRWVTETLATVTAGRLLVIDYASATTAGLARRSWREWLRTYRGHERGAHYLRDPGSQDVTTEVALDQLFRAAGPADAVRPQAQFLQRWGIDELVDEGRRVWAEHAARPTLAAMAMRSRISEAEALTDLSGLGSFTAVEFVSASARGDGAVSG